LPERRLDHLMIFWVLLLLMACKSESEREREQSRGVQPKVAVSNDGSIHLTAAEVQASGLQIEPVAQQNLAPTLSAIGRVVARAGGEAQVFSPFAGRLIADPARLPHVGSTVSKGQILGETEQLISASEQVQFAATEAQLQSAFEQAQQEVQLRQTELNRSRQLYEVGAVPLKQLQAAESEFKQAQSRLEGAKQAQAQYQAILSQQNATARRVPIRAPISGTVVAANLTAGQQMDPADSLLTIADLSNLWIEVTIHESDLGSIGWANSLDFTTPAAPGRRYAAKLVTVGHVVDPSSRTVTVIFAATNLDGSLRLGMTAEARIPTGPAVRALLVPASALLALGDQSVVYVETEAGVYRPRVIVLGQRIDGKIVVVRGLRPGERVVTLGAGALRSEALKAQIPTEGESEER